MAEQSPVSSPVTGCDLPSQAQARNLNAVTDSESQPAASVSTSTDAESQPAASVSTSTDAESQPAASVSTSTDAWSQPAASVSTSADHIGQPLSADVMEQSDSALAGSGPPSSVVITNLPVSLFDNKQQKSVFEEMFSRWDRAAQFSYFGSFRRVVIRYSTPESAACARVYHHETDIDGTLARCYLLQRSGRRLGSDTAGDAEDDAAVEGDGDWDPHHLRPPPLEKQFLISPPASPPVGWCPVRESDPVINLDLLSAVTRLAPGETHELHAGGDGQPSIVVHVAEETERDRARIAAGLPLKMIQTRCPMR